MNEATIRGPWDRVTIERFLEQAVLPISDSPIMAPADSR